MSESANLQDGVSLDVAGYTPLFTFNGDHEDACAVLRGVSGMLTMLSIAAENHGLTHKNTDAVLMVLAGVTDAARSIILRNDE